MATNPKNPSTLIFWNDLENDAELKTCSLAAKGLWTVHMLAIAARSPEPGVVLVGDHPCRIDDDLPRLLARLAGESPDVIAALLAELVASGTASVDEHGRVYNRRKVREEGIRKARAEAGRKGGKAPKTPKANPQQNASKEPSKDESKTAEANAPASVGSETTIPAEPTTDDKQTTKPPESKNEPSSSFMLQASSDVTTTESSLAAASLMAGTEAAAAEDDLTIPKFLRRTPLTERELVDQAFAMWAPVANDIGIADVGFLNSTRRSLLSQRLAEIGGLDGWKLFLEKVRSAEFLRKPDGRPKFWVGLGRLLEPETFSKLLEDRYAERHRADKSEQPTSADKYQALAEFGREGTG